MKIELKRTEIKEIKSTVSVEHKKVQPTKVITASTKDDDEWESF